MQLRKDSAAHDIAEPEAFEVHLVEGGCVTFLGPSEAALGWLLLLSALTSSVHGNERLLSRGAVVCLFP